MAPSILLVDDDPDIREVLTDLLEYHGGIAVLRVLQERVPATPILILTGSDQKATALHNGAFAFLLKPWNHEELLDVLSRAMATA